MTTFKVVPKFNWHDLVLDQQTISCEHRLDAKYSISIEIAEIDSVTLEPCDTFSCEHLHVTVYLKGQENPVLLPTLRNPQAAFREIKNLLHPN